MVCLLVKENRPCRTSSPPEFRWRAIAPVEAGRTVREVAFDLEIGEQTIYNLAAAAWHRHRPGAGVSSSESLELHNARRRIHELEKELAATRRATELLKEATPPKGGSRPLR